MGKRRIITYKNQNVNREVNITNNLLLPNGITPIACKQAHGAVVLCKHNPTDVEDIFREVCIRTYF